MEKENLSSLEQDPQVSPLQSTDAAPDLMCCFEKGIAGGQINITDEIENWPGVIHSSGSELGLPLGSMPNTLKRSQGLHSYRDRDT